MAIACLHSLHWETMVQGDWSDRPMGISLFDIPPLRPRIQEGEILVRRGHFLLLCSAGPLPVYFNSLASWLSPSLFFRSLSTA
jgi:hypothetical protein